MRLLRSATKITVRDSTLRYERPVTGMAADVAIKRRVSATSGGKSVFYVMQQGFSWPGGRKSTVEDGEC
jgi:hypothetical protein